MMRCLSSPDIDHAASSFTAMTRSGALIDCRCAERVSDVFLVFSYVKGMDEQPFVRPEKRES